MLTDTRRLDWLLFQAKKGPIHAINNPSTGLFLNRVPQDPDREHRILIAYARPSESWRDAIDDAMECRSPDDAARRFMETFRRRTPREDG